MLAQANLCRSGLLSKDECPLCLAWTLILDILDDMTTFKGDDWDIFPLHPEDEPGTRTWSPRKLPKHQRLPKIPAQQEGLMKMVTTWLTGMWTMTNMIPMMTSIPITVQCAALLDHDHRPWSHRPASSTRPHFYSGEGRPYCLLWRWFCWAKYLHDAHYRPRTQREANDTIE